MSKEKDIRNIVAEYNNGGKSVIKLRGSLDHEGFASNEFIQHFSYLESISNEIEININCSGGSVLNGLDILTTILDSSVPTTAVISGVAASMGSVIALAADKTIMKDYALIMWHNPFSPDGSVDSESEQIKAMTSMLRKIYSKRLGISEEEIEEYMNGMEGEDGTWFDSDKAIELGLVSEVLETEPQQSVKEIEELALESYDKDIESKLHEIAAKFSVDKNITASVSKDTTSEVVSVIESVSEIKSKKMDLTKLCAMVNVDAEASLETVSAEVKNIVARNKELTQEVSDKEVALVTANTKLENVSAELENEKATVVELEAKVAEFEAEKAKAHAEKIDALLDEAEKGGKINAEAKSTWKNLLEANFESASSALESLPEASSKKVKLSEKVKAEVAPEAKVEVEKKVELPTMEGLMREIANKNK